MLLFGSSWRHCSLKDLNIEFTEEDFSLKLYKFTRNMNNKRLEALLYLKVPAMLN